MELCDGYKICELVGEIHVSLRIRGAGLEEAVVLTVRLYPLDLNNQHSYLVIIIFTRYQQSALLSSYYHIYLISTISTLI